ncbi:MAG TPA: LamG domain-containing protein [Polyangiaceae bacterium]|nr:LamG domain-containing protein [Polyangiaceae bacterium]
MQSGRGRGSSQLAPAALLVVLAGCPQLMDDDFQFSDRLHTTLPDGEVLPDASSDPEGPALRDAGTLPRAEPDAGVDPHGDAGSGAEPADAASSDASGEGGPVRDPTAQALHDALVHRWRFDTLATLGVDSVGGSTAIAKNGATVSGGAAVFAGTGQYVDLPNDVMTGMSSVTVEAWVIWDAEPSGPGSDWQRIFDLGSNSSPDEDVQAANANGIYLSPKSGGPQGKLHFEYRNGGNVNVDAPSALPTGVLVQVAAVVNHESNLLSLYKDGVLVGSLSGASLDPPVTLDLSTVVYKNNWLGRSQYTDPAFKGRIFDFRIYSSALTQPLVEASYTAGADADW